MGVRKNKKKVKKERKEITIYKIVETTKKKKLKEVFVTREREKALKAFELIISENKKRTRFPIKYSSRDHILIESDYEILLLKTRKKNDSEISLLRNKIGILVPHTSNGTMIIYRKEVFLIEETFWVYGYNPKVQRFTFIEILDEILLKSLPDCKYPVKTIIIFKNKLLIEFNDDFEMVICKNENDCARLYSELEKEIATRKLKSVFFSGIASGIRKENIENRISEKTGWNKRKINRNSTRP